MKGGERGGDDSEKLSTGIDGTGGQIPRDEALGAAKINAPHVSDVCHIYDGGSMGRGCS